MPGCTVPNCTNSSQKGYRLHRFPTDKERKSIWVQNCGRERGWKPTKHTCVCEVHFDDMQFESHRADGLKKLKPNAIPTIFSNLPHIRSYNRKPKKNISSKSVLMSSECTEMKLTSVSAEVEANMEEGSNELGEKIKEPEHTYPKFLIIEDKVETRNGESVTTEEVFINVSIASKPDESQTCTPGKETKLQPIKGIGNKCDEWTLKTCQNRKRGRPPDSNGQLHNSADKKVTKLNVSDGKKMEIQEDTKKISSSKLKCRSKERNNGERKQCFVCGKVVDKGLSLFTLTNTTKVYMYQKLDRILTGEMDLLFKEEGILCSRCANLLNYMDRIEVELNMLKKAILNCIRKQCEMECKSDKSQENLVGTAEEAETEVTGKLETEPKTELDHQSVHEENNQNVVKSSVDISQNIQEPSVESTSPEEIVCQVCKFKSIYKSVMFFHLRQHLKEVYWCDFCNTPLSDDAISWREEDNNSVFNLSGSGDDEIEADLTKHEEEIHTSNNSHIINNSNVSLDNPDLLIKVVPVTDDGTLTSKIVEAVASRNYSVDESSDTLGSRKKTKSIRVLNEMGRIVMQEVPISENSEIVKQTDENVSQASEFSELSFQSKPLELQLLEEAKVSELGYDEEEINRSTERVKSYQIINEMGMIMLTEGEDTQFFNKSDIGSDPNELRIHLTPNPLTYSNEQKLSSPVKDGETNDSIFQR